MKNGMRAITRQIRLKEWTEVFRDRAESGMLVKDYCDTHGITKDENDIFFDVENYMTFFSSTSEEESLLEEIKKNTEEIKGIKVALQKIVTQKEGL